MTIRRGIYAALAGPSYETPAEIHMLRSFEADAVGMSTVPEAIVARQMGINILGISCITNMAAGISEQPINHEEVMETGEQVRVQFTQLLRRVIAKIPDDIPDNESESRNRAVSLIIGISGGTGSGKTTVANRILETVEASEVVVIQQDSYYRNLKDLPLDFRQVANFDHPDALDNDLLVNHVRKLKAGESVELPIYDFRTHTRSNETRSVEPKPIVIVEGILIFADPRLLEQLDIKVFVDTPDDIRFIRRLRRDIDERGRTVESVIEQYVGTVRPMHMQFVEPSKRYADVIIPEGGHNLVSIDLISGKIRERLAGALTSVGGQS